MNDSTYDYYSKILDVLQKEKHPSIHIDNYITQSQDYNWNSQTDVAKMILYFIETSQTPDDYLPNLTSYDLEHIWPKSKIKSLSTTVNLHLLGNLTLLEGKKVVVDKWVIDHSKIQNLILKKLIIKNLHVFLLAIFQNWKHLTRRN